MTQSTADIYEALTAPDGPFPVAVSAREGRSTQVYDRGPYTLVEAFVAAREHGSADALVYGEQRWTYAEQWQVVNALASSLRERFQIVPGDRIALAMRNYPEWPLAFWAAQLLGAVVVPLNAWFTGRELAALLAESRSILLIADPDRIDRVAAEPGAKTMLRGQVVVRGARPDAVAFEELVEGASGAQVEPHLADPDDVATILYTSGTTGVPKGVLATHRNHVSIILTMRMRAEAVRIASGVPVAGPHTTQGATLVASPLFHIAALTAMTSNAYAGRRVVLMYKWDLADGMALIERERVSEMSGPPAVLRQVADGAARGDYDVSSLASVVSGAAPAPPQLVRDLAAMNGGAVSAGTGYGSTETTSTVVTITGADYVARPTSVGRALPTVEIRACDAAGGPVGVGVAGELEVRSPQVAVGYADNPEATAAAFSPDGWYRTGDLVTIDDEGFVYLVGRLKDVINRGGENVYCAEVERAIGEHPDVVESAVIGRPHPTLGEEVGAVIRFRVGHALDRDELTRFLAPHLAAFKIPTWLQVTDEPLPRTATGKVVKDEVRANLEREPAT